MEKDLETTCFQISTIFDFINFRLNIVNSSYFRKLFPATGWKKFAEFDVV